MCSFGSPTFLENLFVRLIFHLRPCPDHYYYLLGKPFVRLIFYLRPCPDHWCSFTQIRSWLPAAKTLTDLLAFCEFSFGPLIIIIIIIIITDPPGRSRQRAVHTRFPRIAQGLSGRVGDAEAEQGGGREEAAAHHYDLFRCREYRLRRGSSVHLYPTLVHVLSGVSPVRQKTRRHKLY